MKKRKSPILLLTILAVLVGGVVFYGMRQDNSTAPVADAPSQDSVTSQEKHDAPSPTSVADKIRTDTEKAKAAAGRPTKMPNEDPNSKGPSIAVNPSSTGYPAPKQAPGGSTDSQWYAH